MTQQTLIGIPQGDPKPTLFEIAQAEARKYASSGPWLTDEERKFIEVGYTEGFHEGFKQHSDVLKKMGEGK